VPPVARSDWYRAKMSACSFVDVVFRTGRRADQIPRRIDMLLRDVGLASHKTECESALQPRVSHKEASGFVQFFKERGVHRVESRRIVRPRGVVAEADRRQGDRGQELEIRLRFDILCKQACKGNVRPYTESLDQNLRYLEQFKARNAESSIR